MTRTLNQVINQWLELSTETVEGQGYDQEFVVVTDVQLNVEVTKPSLGATTNLPDDLKNKTKLY